MRMRDKPRLRMSAGQPMLGRGALRMFRRTVASSGASIVATAASASITSGDALPTADTIQLTFTVTGDASAFDATDVDLSSTFSGYAANRALDFSNVTIVGSSGSFAIVNVAVSNTIIGGNNFTSGTPQTYDNDDNKLTYTGTDATNLPGLGSFSNLALSLTGDTVPVVCKLEWNAGTLFWDLEVTFSANIDTAYAAAFSGIATNLGLQFSDTSASAVGNVASLTGEDNVNLYTGASVGSDRIAMSSGGVELSSVPAPAFTFPLYVVGGALAKPNNSVFSSGSGTIVTSFTRDIDTTPSLGSVGAFTAWFNNKTLLIEGSATGDGIALTLSEVSEDAPQSHTSQVVYDGSSLDFLDDQSRPVPPYTQTLTGS